MLALAWTNCTLAANTEFACRSGGSNLNAGTRTGNSTVPGTAADFTYASGNFVQSTGVFTVASGNPQTDGVAVNDFASVYADGSTTTGFVGRVTARNTTTITVSLTAKVGTAPTDGTGNRTLKIGGAWKGPNGTDLWPFSAGTTLASLTDSTGNPPRINMKNDATYSITSAMTYTQTGSVVFQGFSSAYGDRGQAVIDGGTSGASYILLSFGGSNGIADIIFDHNGSTGSANGVSTNGIVAFQRCVFRNMVGSGINVSGTTAIVSECEAHGNNTSNTANLAGFLSTSTSSSTFIRCIAHDNTGSNNNGFLMVGGGLANYVSCIADTNGKYGFGTNVNSGQLCCVNCDAYNNTSHGFFHTHGSTARAASMFQNCNATKNGGYGIACNVGTVQHYIVVVNCGFGAGTEANTSGTTNVNTATFLDESGSVTYGSNLSPYVDAANGDFRISLSAAKGAGRGAFMQTAASYAGTVGYPDIGAPQHVDASSSGVGARVIQSGGRL